MSNQYTLKVYLPGMARSVYRIIQISGRDTLDKLCSVILDSFDFSHEHLYEFCMDNRMYMEYNFQSHPQHGEPSSAIALDKLCLAKGQNFSLHYDFGDDWMFTIHVQKIESETRKSAPAVLRAAGEVEQYPSWDEEEEDVDEFEVIHMDGRREIIRRRDI